jgi:hypothetical protein
MRTYLVTRALFLCALADLVQLFVTLAKPLELTKFELEKTSEIPSLASICFNVTLDSYAKAAMEAEGSRRRFFPKFREVSHTTLTAQPYLASGIKLKGNAENAVFVGDSVINEIYKSYERMLGSESASCVSMRDTGLNASGVIAYKDRLEMAYSQKPFNLAFLGGLGLHHMLRDKHSLGGASGVAKPHKEVVGRYLAMFHQLAVNLGVAVVFVGVPTVDAATIMMSTAKHDFLDFNDLALPTLWDAVEVRAFQEEERKRIISSDKEAGEGGAEGGGGRGGSLWHLRLAKLTNTCPGVRCDGMHFNSYGRECEPSSGLWDHFLGDFLLQHFGD